MFYFGNINHKKKILFVFFWLIYSVNCIIKLGNIVIGLCTVTINQLKVILFKNMTRLDKLGTLLRDCTH